MKQILLIGAGKSATVLIDYLLNNAGTYGWHLTIGDADPHTAASKLKGHSHGSVTLFNADDDSTRDELVSRADLVISMLPATMHVPVAHSCIKFGKHLITASYVSPEMAVLDEQAKERGCVLLNEMGLDPGIDHMSALQIIHRIQNEGGKITSFKSFTGGLVAPESIDNPWGYKFTWNPRNVIVAGQSTARYLHNCKLKFIPYNRLFKNVEQFDIAGLGMLEGYANRDSLGYIEPYNLHGISTMLRGTLRYKNYCNAWDCFVQLGLTDDSFIIPHSENLSYIELVQSLLPEGITADEASLIAFLGLDNRPELFAMLQWTGIFSNDKAGIPDASPARLLQHLLEQKWKLNPGDLDLVVMLHEFEYTLNGQAKKVTSTLALKGDDALHTAMAKTVGLPVAIAAKLILTGKWQLSGVKIPNEPLIYNPVLQELEEHGVIFNEIVT
ncbi:MAG: saccharopine dehydrogenase NADP-binding domain-containing protein [Sphingobacteriales bacterium JAD_PAG50586_3]|nr:MAG: saccharopine dehydrogenase NADP-binding domain-containing protein [Sphingobacteriales bacterium JAD_PAG50586_3]